MSESRANVEVASRPTEESQASGHKKGVEGVPDSPLRAGNTRDGMLNPESAMPGLQRTLGTSAHSMAKPVFHVQMPEPDAEDGIFGKLKPALNPMLNPLPTPTGTPGPEGPKQPVNAHNLNPLINGLFTPAATPDDELGPRPGISLDHGAKNSPILDEVEKLKNAVEFPYPLIREEPKPVIQEAPAKIVPESAASTSIKETWDKTLERVVNGIVSIKATGTRNFDTEGAGDYTATGFVIDKEKGLILSNRHVVSPAPITAVAVFVNYEEVPIQPVYRDPTHDFGIFRYDPSKLKHIKVEEIELCPDAAKVGEDIKVVGNDSGEKLSILGSTLARLDREAPSYGVNSYNDFNTFYMQAASGTSGGSSGSPVLNIYGQAVALNAGGSNSSQSSFYLPLNRVVRAVEYIKKGQEPPRGTLQTEFQHQSYDELRRLGLTDAIEKECRERNSKANGLLSVTRVLRGGPASSERENAPKELPAGFVAGLEPGDILLSCNEKPIIDFIGLFEIVDEAVGEEIVLGIMRQGELRSCRLTVQNLHSITPNRFLEFGGAILHDLSYQIGRNHNVQLGTGVFCAG